jgi:hypothetical protein
VTDAIRRVFGHDRQLRITADSRRRRLKVQSGSVSAARIRNLVDARDQRCTSIIADLWIVACRPEVVEDLKKLASSGVNYETIDAAIRVKESRNALMTFETPRLLCTDGQYRLIKQNENIQPRYRNFDLVLPPVNNQAVS